ncbi:MAG: glycosyl hydrolase [Flavobacteriales bacterium]|nr:glycosyl hydrolase [Flavobacteriales bacterium]MBT3963935.1 glycosyl hydrolase [Flavobacteriales bacterium]MBT4704042.1 glycosyl hydrolase [Flavobacteriales bacterium]MBT4930262.1 glycosyl hydrolase [Flavobacteriales bacterium]MBT5132485.1 glycosyl hydrolase [Flavobacteriales bacterium]
MKNAILLLTVFATVLCTANAQKSKTGEDKKPVSLSGLSFRALGPALVSGRIIDLAVNPTNHDEFFVAAASGGVWKTTNHGTTFSPVFDAQGSYSIGCVSYDPSNPHTVWVGTGENNNQRSVAYGDGVYRSLDDGKSWKNMGLKSSEHIAKIIVHPEHSEIVYVAAYGPLWSAGGDRGIYKTVDGGENWERIHFVSEHTGFSDLWMDPRDPMTMYAAAHQRRRHVYTYLSGGPESTVYKTTDGGETWRKIAKGFPKSDLGRIALAISPVNPDVVYAMVEGYDKEHGGFYKSENRGESWNKQSDYYTSGNYYVELIPDPKDVDKVYSMDTWLHHTVDGGKTFKKTGEKSKHVDNHAMWVNPANTDHWLVGCDGGLYETFDGAANWKFFQNLNLTQFYRVAVDYDEPFYNVYGGTQDNNTIGGPSRTTNAHGISNFDWYVTRGGDGFEPAVDPTDPNIVYSQAQYGWLARFNKETGERVNIKPVERKGEDAYRWNWDAPLLISHHDNKRLYFSANKVFKSDSRGDAWDVVSEDLTQQIDRNKLEIMGTTWGPDAVALHKSTSIYGNLVAMDESPVQKELLYVGTDDGIIQRTEDLNAWTKLTSFPGVPSGTYVNDVKGDRFDANTVYAAFNNHKRGDFKPYILKSIDKGNSWVSITGDLPERGSVYSIAQDHVDKNLLFAGTEFGFYFSANAGKNWVKIGGGLPTIGVRDIDIQRRENDIVLASFGRGFYVLDDYSPLRTLGDSSNVAAHIYPIKDALTYNITNPLGTKGKASQGESFFTTPNPPIGATFTYFLKEKPKTNADSRRAGEKKIRKDGGKISYPSLDALKLEDVEAKPYLIFEITNEKGEVVRRFKESKAAKGINRTTWDFRLESSSPISLKQDDGGRYGSPDHGMLALPGKYSVSIYQFQDGKLSKIAGPTSFNIKRLHDGQISKADREALVAFVDDINVARNEMRGASEELNHLKKQIEFMSVAVLKTPSSEVSWLEELDQARKTLVDLEYSMWGDRTRGKREMESYPGIAGRIELVVYNVKSHTEAPTEGEKSSLKAATDEFAILKPQVASLQKSVNELSTKLKAAGSSYYRE